MKHKKRDELVLIVGFPVENKTTVVCYGRRDLKIFFVFNTPGRRWKIHYGQNRVIAKK